MSGQAVALVLGIVAGVCVGASGLHQLQRPHPGWLLAGVLAAWLALLYAGVWSV